jgi:hypothetical protein
MTRHLTRRALMAGLAALSVPVLPAVALTAPEPDGGVRQLVDQFFDVQRRSLDANEAAEVCEIAARRTFPKRPRVLMGKRSGYGSKPYFYPLTAQDVNEWWDQAQEVFKFDGSQKAKREKQRQLRLRRLAWWERREQAFLEAAAWPALKARADALDAEQDRLINAIIGCWARSMGDVEAKVRFLGNWEPFAAIDLQPENMGAVESAYVSLWLDVRRLAGKAGAAEPGTA